MKNIKKNNLTMKTLQVEIDKLQEQLKSNHKRSTAAEKTNDIKHSYIQNLHMKSSMFMLWIITAVLSYAHKIPFIKQIITALSIIYGRTTIWKILVKVRKVFILFNAAIGVFMVFKTVGFGYENVLAGFVGMGHSYLEIFTNFTKRMFNWFVELFDHRVVPNVPGDNTGNAYKKIWSNGPIDKSAFNPQYPTSGSVEDSLRKSYNSLLNIQVEPVSASSWYKDISTWLWILGGITVVYFGYKLIFDPLIIENITSGSTTAKPSPTDGAGPSTEIYIQDNRGATDFTSAIGSFIRKIKTNINPFNWIIASSETGYATATQNFKTFMERQNHMETADRTLYPFTTINPYLPWYEQLKINLFGESVFENLKRFKDMEYADRIVKMLEVSKGQYLEVKGATPNIWSQATSNYSTPIPRTSFIDTIHTYNIHNQLKSIPTTPTILPVAENILSDVGEWKIHEKAQFTGDTDNWLRTWKGAKAASTSVIPSTETEIVSMATPNKFSVLEID